MLYYIYTLKEKTKRIDNTFKKNKFQNFNSLHGLPYGKYTNTSKYIYMITSFIHVF